MVAQELRLDGKYRYAGLIWAFSVVCLLTSEALLILWQIHRHEAPFSLSFWYVPFAITAPLSIGFDIYRRLKTIFEGEVERDHRAAMSYYVALLVSVANTTVVIGATKFLT
jgi:hypothetical protein